MLRTVVGLEVHVQVATARKLFSRSPRDAGAPPNTCVSRVDMALPGALPVLNLDAVRQGVRTALALGGRVSLQSRFDRKHYFYPDLPAGYQITQHLHPLMRDGRLAVPGYLSEQDVVISSMHLEQDSGKSLHDQHVAGSLVDLNRAGSALLEIVTAPCITGASHAVAFLRELQRVLRRVGSSDAAMEHGGMRCDVNVSVHPPGDDTLQHGTRVEVKNLNSFQAVGRAIEYEAERHREAIAAGTTLVAETRSFDADAGVTRVMRRKETAPDYRFFPDPDLPAVQLTQRYIHQLASELPELPAAQRHRLTQQYQLEEATVAVLVDRDTEDAVRLLELAVDAGADAQLTAKFVTSDVFRHWNRDASLVTAVSARQLAALVRAVSAGDVAVVQAKRVLDMMFAGDQRSPDQLIDELGVRLVQTDADALRKTCLALVQRHSTEAAAYRDGRERMLGFFVGQVMKQSKGKANPKDVSKMMKQVLSSPSSSSSASSS